MISLFNVIGDIGAEGGVAAVMGKDLLTVKHYSCRCVYTVEFNIKSLILGKIGSCKLLLVDTGATPVIVAAVLSVMIVPGVRNVDFCLCAVVITEQPIVVDKQFSTHINLLWYLFEAVPNEKFETASLVLQRG